jgi:glycosyltransferase involved in cell wall biosynthesis
MRVTHIVPALFGPDGVVGGAERYALELARHMAEVVPTTLVAFGDAAREEQFGRLRVRVLAGAWHVRGQRTNPFHLALFGALGETDVVHCHQQHVLTSSAVALWGRVTGRPVFVSDLGGGGWDVSAYVSTDAWFTGHLHISEYSRRVQGHEAWPRARVILGGVDTERFSPDPLVPRSGGVLFVGRLRPHKGVDDLIAGMPARLPLTVVGPPPDHDMAARLHGLARGKTVTFKHTLDDRLLVDEYRRATCVVLPSVYRSADGSETQVPELLGQTLLEGMACEAAAVCTRVASMPEVVEDGVTGFVVPPNDPAVLGARLAWLSEHPDDARAMGRAGRARVLTRFTWARVVDRCLDAYRPQRPSLAHQRTPSGEDTHREVRP